MAERSEQLLRDPTSGTGGAATLLRHLEGIEQRMDTNVGALARELAGAEGGQRHRRWTQTGIALSALAGILAAFELLGNSDAGALVAVTSSAAALALGAGLALLGAAQRQRRNDRQRFDRARSVIAELERDTGFMWQLVAGFRDSGATLPHWHRDPEAGPMERFEQARRASQIARHSRRGDAFRASGDVVDYLALLAAIRAELAGNGASG